MRSLRQRRFLSVIAAVEAAREAHPELAYRLNAHRLSRVFAREGIAVLRRPITSRAYVQGGDGAFVIVLSSELQGRYSTRVLAHEYGHIRLHMTEMAEQGEVVTQLAPCRRGDPREYEAELFALLLRLGPTATPDQADVARLVAKLEAPAYRARITELSDPEGDAFAEQMWRHAQTESVPNRIRGESESLVQFAVPREAWRAVRFDEIARSGASYPHYESRFAGPTHELVTCTESAAREIVAQLARAGHKRTAVHIRRTIREVRTSGRRMR